MSLAFVLFCLWLLVALPSGFAPLAYRGQLRLGLLAAGGALTLLALSSGGVVPGLCALVGVLVVFPQPLGWARDMIAAQRRARRAMTAPA